MDTYPMIFREKVAAAYHACGSSSQVARLFGCSESWVRRLIQRQRESGSLSPRPAFVPNCSKFSQEDLEELGQLIQVHPDMTLEELSHALTTKVSVTTIHRATQKLKISFKKSRSMPPNKTARTSKPKEMPG